MARSATAIFLILFRPLRPLPSLTYSSCNFIDLCVNDPNDTCCYIVFCVAHNMFWVRLFRASLSLLLRFTFVRCGSNFWKLCTSDQCMTCKCAMIQIMSYSVPLLLIRNDICNDRFNFIFIAIPADSQWRALICKYSTCHFKFTAIHVENPYV